MSPEKTGRSAGSIRLVYLCLPLVLGNIGCQAFDRLRDGPASKDADALTGLPPRTDPDRRGVNVTSTYDNPSNRTTAAGLAAAPSRKSDDLRISDARRSDRDRNLQPTGWNGNGDERPPAASGANLRAPTIGSSALDSRPVRPVERDGLRSSTAGPGPRIRSFEDGQQFLMARGVKWQRLETTGEGEWKFSCSIPTRPGATSMKTYEGRDKFGLIAMQNVIDQIVRDQQR